jgi:hypothetical protein
MLGLPFTYRESLLLRVVEVKRLLPVVRVQPRVVTLHFLLAVL